MRSQKREKRETEREREKKVCVRERDFERDELL